jgi:hypothetical protein
VQVAVEGVESCAQSGEAGAGLRVSAADAVVDDRDDQCVVLCPRVHLCRSGSGVAGHVGEIFADEEVGRGLDRRREPAAQDEIEVDRYG